VVNRKEIMGKYYGILPAAGLALRMRPFRYPKELLPVHFESVNGNEFIRPKLLIEYSLEALSIAGVKDIYIVVPDWKPEIMRYLEDGEQFGHHISYLYNSKALGLADALLSGYEWLRGNITCFAMPDTMFSPTNAFQSIINVFHENNADLVLGVFPTEEARHFAPVEFDLHGKVLNIWEKPEQPKYNNAWGIGVWGGNFWEYFKSRSDSLKPGISVTDTFDKAAKEGLRVYSVYFDNGSYRDVGRINNIEMMK
jgi:glucose-1-phosphate thymidylyltransferase